MIALRSGNVGMWSGSCQDFRKCRDLVGKCRDLVYICRYLVGKFRDLVGMRWDAPGCTMSQDLLNQAFFLVEVLLNDNMSIL